MPVTKVDKLDDSTFAELEETWERKLDDSKMYALAGRGSSFTSNRVQNPRKQSLTVPAYLPRHKSPAGAIHALQKYIKMQGDSLAMATANTLELTELVK